MKRSFFTRAMGISVPVALQAMLQSSFSIVDQLMVGQLGAAQIAAVEVGGKPGFVFTFVSGAIATVTGIMVSQYMGKGEEESVSGGMSVNLCAMLLVAALAALLCLAVPAPLAALFTGDTAVIAGAAGYMRLIAPAFPLSGAASVLAVELRCRDKAKLPLYISAASVAVNTLLNRLLIFGGAGLPALGVRGAAIASVASQAVNLALMIAAYRGRCRFRFRPNIGRRAFRQYLAMLLPIVANEFMWTVGQSVYTGIYGHMGTSELAGMALTGPVQGLLIGALSGLSQAAGILIGQRLGQGDYESAYRESVRLCLYGLIGSLALSGLLVLARGLYVGLFRVDGNVRAIGSRLLLAFAVLAPVKVQNMILGGGVIRSGGKTRYIMAIDLAGTWLVGVPLGLLAGVVLKWPIHWVYFALSQEELFRLVLTAFMFRSRKWMNTIE